MQDNQHTLFRDSAGRNRLFWALRSKLSEEADGTGLVEIDGSRVDLDSNRTYLLHPDSDPSKVESVLSICIDMSGLRFDHISSNKCEGRSKEQDANGPGSCKEHAAMDAR